MVPKIVSRRFKDASDEDISRLWDARTRLIHITEHCRPDMHEPDNAGVYGKVTGRTLDNAMGDDPTSNELVLEIRNNMTDEVMYFNIADLINLARRCPIIHNKVTL
jgi:hypothetical protein